MSCEASSLVQASRCFGCIPPGMQAAVQSYLLASIAGGSMDPATLLREAACNASCLPPNLLPEIKTSLLCQIVENTSPVIPEPECDADAQAFITAANITDVANQNAICKLVADLKAYPAVGTKYWDRDVLIYPFVSNPTDGAAAKALSHSVNLKTPGVNDLTYIGVALGHSDLGVQGVNGGGANTGYVPAAPLTATNTRVMWYVNQETVNNATHYFGIRDTTPTERRVTARANLPVGSFDTSCNDNSTTNAGVGNSTGARFIQRQEAPNRQIATPTTPWSTQARAVTAMPTIPFYVCSYNNVGALSSNNDSIISSLTLGTVLDVGGGDVERLEYTAIWDRFQSALSVPRKKP